MNARQLGIDIWDDLLEREVATPGHVPAEVLDWDGRADPFVCLVLASDQSLHIMMSVEQGSVVPDIRSLRGLAVSMLSDHQIIGYPRQSYLDLRCTAEAFIVPFTRVAQDTAMYVLRDGLHPSLAVERVVEEWRAFWAPTDRPPLSEERQRGLIGELLVLEAMVGAGIDGVAAWEGPDRDRHDFRTTSIAIEVKFRDAIRSMVSTNFPLRMD